MIVFGRVAGRSGRPLHHPRRQLQRHRPAQRERRRLGAVRLHPVRPNRRARRPDRPRRSTHADQQRRPSGLVLRPVRRVPRLTRPDPKRPRPLLQPKPLLLTHDRPIPAKRPQHLRRAAHHGQRLPRLRPVPGLRYLRRPQPIRRRHEPLHLPRQQPTKPDRSIGSVVDRSAEQLGVEGATRRRLRRPAVEHPRSPRTASLVRPLPESPPRADSGPTTVEIAARTTKKCVLWDCLKNPPPTSHPIVHIPQCRNNHQWHNESIDALAQTGLVPKEAPVGAAAPILIIESSTSQRKRRATPLNLRVWLSAQSFSSTSGRWCGRAESSGQTPTQ